MGQPDYETTRTTHTKRTVASDEIWIDVRVAKTDRDALNAWAAVAGLSASKIMRRLLEEALAQGRDLRGEVPLPTRSYRRLAVPAAPEPEPKKKARRRAAKSN